MRAALVQSRAEEPEATDAAITAKALLAETTEFVGTTLKRARAELVDGLDAHERDLHVLRRMAADIRFSINARGLALDIQEKLPPSARDDTAFLGAVRDAPSSTVRGLIGSRVIELIAFAEAIRASVALLHGAIARMDGNDISGTDQGKVLEIPAAGSKAVALRAILASLGETRSSEFRNKFGFAGSIGLSNTTFLLRLGEFVEEGLFVVVGQARNKRYVLTDAGRRVLADFDPHVQLKPVAKTAEKRAPCESNGKITPRERLKERILAYVQEHGSIHNDVTMRSGLGRTRDAVSAAIRELIAEEKLVMIGKGRGDNNTRYVFRDGFRYVPKDLPPPRKKREAQSSWGLAVRARVRDCLLGYMLGNDMTDVLVGDARFITTVTDEVGLRGRTAIGDYLREIAEEDGLFKIGVVEGGGRQRRFVLTDKGREALRAFAERTAKAAL